jgi:hypothetical protein
LLLVPELLGPLALNDRRNELESPGDPAPSANPEPESVLGALGGGSVAIVGPISGMV